MLNNITERRRARAPVDSQRDLLCMVIPHFASLLGACVSWGLPESMLESGQFTRPAENIRKIAVRRPGSLCKSSEKSRKNPKSGIRITFMSLGLSILTRRGILLREGNLGGLGA